MTHPTPAMEAAARAPRYIEEAPFDEAMRALAEGRDPLKHTVWTGDFMGICTHDIACIVCFDAPAVIHRDVSIGSRRPQTVQPCHSCQAKGYETRRKPWWQRALLSLKRQAGE